MPPGEAAAVEWGDSMSIASDLMRGNTEMILLARLMKKESYGYEINKVIQAATGGQLELKEATLYGAFCRLEAVGHIVSYWGDETTGARRRYYRITPAGRQAFAQSRAEWEQARRLIDKLIAQEGENHD